jgi:hypothetical protein
MRGATVLKKEKSECRQLGRRWSSSNAAYSNSAEWVALE